MRNTIDMAPFACSTIGFDRLLDQLEHYVDLPADNYPPYDIEKLGDDRYRVVLAVAGTWISPLSPINSLSQARRPGQTTYTPSIAVSRCNPLRDASTWPTTLS